MLACVMRGCEGEVVVGIAYALVGSSLRICEGIDCTKGEDACGRLEVICESGMKSRKTCAHTP